MIRKEFCSLNKEESEENEKKCKDSHGSDAVSEKFLKTRQIMLYDEIDSDSAEKVIRQLLILEADSDKPIYLYINSPGGSVTAGLAIYDTMQHIRADVQTICLGQAASMGAFLLCSGAKGKRMALPHSRVLIHQPLGGAQGQATDIEIQAAEIIRIKKSLNEKCDSIKF